MRSDPRPCSEIADQLEAYRSDGLEAQASRAVFSHLLRCPDCHQKHWQPYVSEATWLAQRLFDAMAGEESSRDGEGSRDAFGAPVTHSNAVSPTWLDVTTWMGDDPPPASPRTPIPPPLNDRLEVSPAPAVTAVAQDGVAGTSGEKTSSLRLVGMCLPVVPKPEVLRGYELYLGAGPPTTERNLEHGALLRITVEAGVHTVQLESLTDGCRLDGAAIPPGSQRRLQWTHLLEVAAEVYLLTLRTAPIDGRGDIGQLRHRGSSWSVGTDPVRVGRDQTLDIRLPDGQTNTNLLWRLDALEAIPDTARRKRLLSLTLDSHGVSREHAVLEHRASRLMVRPCRTQAVAVFRGEEAITLEGSEQVEALAPGDEVQIGHHLFAVEG